MKKRAIALILVICSLTILFTACGRTSSKTSAVWEAPATATATPKTSQPATTSTTPKPAAVPTPEPTPDETAVVHMKTASLLRSNTASLESCIFNEGVAWAMIRIEGNETKLAIINKKGEVVSLLDESDFSRKLSDITTTPFINGLSVVGAEKIVDKYGQIVFSSTDYEGMSVVWQADDGSIFILHHTEAGFSSESVYSIYIFDIESGPINTDVQVNKDCMYCKNVYYICEGLYYFEQESGHGYFLNLKNNSFINCMRRHYSFSNQNNEYVMLEESGVHYVLPKKLLVNATSSSDIKDICSSDSCYYLGNGYGKTLSNWMNNTIFVETDHSSLTKRQYSYEYIDLLGNTVFSYPEFPEGVTYNDVVRFKDGYSALSLKGVDKQQYVTIIDEQASIQYEPVVFYNAFCTCDGYVFGWKGKELSIINPAGIIKNIGDRLDGLEDASSSYYYYNAGTSRYFAINEGFIFWAADSNTPLLFSVDGNTIIETVQLNYNINSELLYTGEDGLYHVGTKTDQDKTTAAVQVADAVNQKEYINPNNFSIKGKWKNIGTYTFGQVQSGAIVSFDGKNCNVYSPSDTYAFYKEGNDYRLDCTSMLFSETLSFTVKIVDKDHIDIYYGSDFLEMQRVS